VDDAVEITVLQLPRFKAEAMELIGADGIEALAVYLLDHPDAGDVMPGSDHLPVPCRGRQDLPVSLLCQERQDGFDGGREAAAAANRSLSERSAIKCPEKR
jgi:hypothetical protein